MKESLKEKLSAANERIKQLQTERDELEYAATKRRQADLAKPYRTVAVTVFDSSGHTISNMTHGLNRGDDVSVGIDSTGDIHFSTNLDPR